jgi:hypothetical protein
VTNCYISHLRYVPPGIFQPQASSLRGLFLLGSRSSEAELNFEAVDPTCYPLNERCMLIVESKLTSNVQNDVDDVIILRDCTNT